MIDVVVDNASAYELLLQTLQDKGNRAVDFDKLGRKLKDLIGSDVVGLAASTRKTAWDSRGDEGRLCLIKMNMDKLLAQQDYFSFRKTNLDNLEVVTCKPPVSHTCSHILFSHTKHPHFSSKWIIFHIF